MERGDLAKRLRRMARRAESVKWELCEHCGDENDMALNGLAEDLDGLAFDLEEPMDADGNGPLRMTCLYCGDRFIADEGHKCASMVTFGVVHADTAVAH